MTPEEAVIDRLLGTSAVTALVAQRVWLLRLPQRAVFPAIRVQLIDDPQTKHLRGPNDTTAARVQVDCYEAETGATPYETIGSMADAVTDALVNEPFEASGSPASIRVLNVERIDRRAMYEADELQLLRMFMDFRVWSKRVS